MHEKLVQVLTQAGAPIPFPEFVVAVRAAGGRAETWLRAKHDGVLDTRIVNGVHLVGLPGAFESEAVNG